MNSTTIILALALSASSCALTAQNANAQRQGQNPPPREGVRNNGPARDDGPEESSLTEAQKEQVKSILARFDRNALTADTARAIHEAFREAGLRGGRAMADSIKAAGFDPEKLRDLAPPAAGRAESASGRGAEDVRSQGSRRGGAGNPRADEGRPGPGGPEGYSIEQAISDRAQLNTIAFDGLAFLTGDMGCNTFLPPGKVADYCGFQFMRDTDRNELGHNTSFVPRAANSLLAILDDAQKAKLIALAREQEALITQFAQKRFPLVQAFCRELDGNIPAGSSGLSREAVMNYTASIYEIDGRLSYRRAEVLGGIIRSFTESQRSRLARLSFNDSSTWPELADQVDKRSLPHAAHVAVMTYASEMFSWYAGSLEADVYFCPERHATYFGSFYMKDIPAMGNANFSISTSLTGDSGEAFLEALTGPQRALITGLVEQQRADLSEIVATRQAIAAELRRFMKEPSVDEGKVMALSRRYGELDGEISYFYATAFAKVGRTLTDDQRQTLLKLRNLDSKFTCKGAYLYSRAIEMPEIPSTDFLFAPGAAPTQGARADAASR